MSKTVLILGGYGTFGQIIAEKLSFNYAVILAGRNLDKATSLATKLNQRQDAICVKAMRLNADNITPEMLQNIDLVVHTCGPFQGQDYSVPLACIKSGTHCIDLADAKDYVSNINTLNDLSHQHKTCIISGASTVPCLSSAVIEHFKKEFLNIDSLKYGITPGQKSPRGLATTKGILSYLGKKIHHQSFGWQDLYFENYPEIGKRPMGNCDIPDLAIFPKKYNINTIQFSAGMESYSLHLCIWLTSWLVRLGLPVHLPKHAKTLLNISHLFDVFGTSQGGMHMHLKGSGIDEKPLTIKWYIIAKNNHGPHIPTVPAIALTHKILQSPSKLIGAQSATNTITLNEYLDFLKDFDIKTMVFKNP